MKKITFFIIFITLMSCEKKSDEPLICEHLTVSVANKFSDIISDYEPRILVEIEGEYKTIYPGKTESIEILHQDDRIHYKATLHSFNLCNGQSCANEPSYKVGDPVIGTIPIDKCDLNIDFSAEDFGLSDCLGFARINLTSDVNLSEFYYSCEEVVYDSCINEYYTITDDTTKNFYFAEFYSSPTIQGLTTTKIDDYNFSLSITNLPRELFIILVRDTYNNITQESKIEIIGSSPIIISECDRLDFNFTGF